MTELYLVRHAESEDNRRRLFSGWSDPPLSSHGEKQAALLARKLAEIPIDRFYSSPSRRCLQTVRPLAAERGAEVTVIDSLREINFGSWEGLTYDEVLKKYPGEARAWAEDPTSVRVPGGECFDDLVQRAGAAVTGLIRTHQGPGRLLLSVHGGVVRALLYRFLGLSAAELARLPVGPASITILDVCHGRASLIRWQPS